jgi:hypothetical protein
VKPIFSRNPDYNKNAFINWRINKDNDILNLFNIAEVFMQSAINLARLCLMNNNDKKADIVIFPILTDANHGIELYLKSILLNLDFLLNEQSKPICGHNIKQLYETVRSKVKLYDNERLTLKEFDIATEGLSEYIKELFLRLEDTRGKNQINFSRYPFEKELESHFYVQVGNVEVDLENFVTRFEDIHDALENLSSYLYNAAENRAG